MTEKELALARMYGAGSDEVGVRSGVKYEMIARWKLVDPLDIIELMDEVIYHWVTLKVGYVIEDRQHRTYYFHTGGWTNNQHLIDALKENTIFWKWHYNPEAYPEKGLYEFNY